MTTFVVRALDSEQKVQPRVLISRTDQKGITLYMDSGANETMLKDEASFISLDPRQTLISTATGQTAATGIYGTPKSFSFVGSNRRVPFGREGKAVWCDKLNDNLLSVGRLCDAGFSVVFTSHDCFVFAGEHFRGKPVHQQARDASTGLYPISLVRDFAEDCRPMRLPGDSGGAHGASNIHAGIDIADVRHHFGKLSEWASAKIAEGRGGKIGPRLKIIFQDFDGRMTHGRLARFYVPSSLSNLDGTRNWDIRGEKQ